MILDIALKGRSPRSSHENLMPRTGRSRTSAGLYSSWCGPVPLEGRGTTPTYSRCAGESSSSVFLTIEIRAVQVQSARLPMTGVRGAPVVVMMTPSAAQEHGLGVTTRSPEDFYCLSDSCPTHRRTRSFHSRTMRCPRSEPTDAGKQAATQQAGSWGLRRRGASRGDSHAFSGVEGEANHHGSAPARVKGAAARGTAPRPGEHGSGAPRVP